MIDINLIRTNPEIVKENIKKKFQFAKLELVDQVIALDSEYRKLKQEGDNLRASRNSLSQAIGKLMKAKQIDEANKIKEQVVLNNAKMAEIEVREEELGAEIKKIMMVIPNIIDDSVPIGEDDTKNVEIQKLAFAV